MAKRVCCADNDVDKVLEEHEKDWVLVDVVPYTVRGILREPDEEVRELYFEKKEAKK